MAAAGAAMELARPAQATLVLMGITVWAAVALSLEPVRYVRLAAHLDSTTAAALGATMELARRAQATAL